jgi:hypothetical protein
MSVSSREGDKLTQFLKSSSAEYKNFESKEVERVVNMDERRHTIGSFCLIGYYPCDWKTEKNKIERVHFL